ncbi:MAG TPA: serine/threonine-protein phosphatase [Gammaproteobacteria bacterium]|nr:serine/threonine-protein phosphatase [Gammaproteobacteria bacterium]
MNATAWIEPPRTEPQAWYCDVVWGGNRLALESFTMPGLEGRLLSVPSDYRDEGGDLYHVTVCDRGVFSKFLLLDVAGHGAAAARISKRLQQPLAELMTELDNTAILDTLNHRILEREANGNFATVAAATYNHWDSSWTYAYAGHPCMLVRRNGCWQALPECHAGPPVGILGDSRYYQNELRLDDGDWLFLFSDGVLDIHNGDGRRLGYEGLTELVNQAEDNDIDDFYRRLITRLVALNGGERFTDDLTLILLKRKTGTQTLPERTLAAGRRLLMRWMKRNSRHCRIDLPGTQEQVPA